MAGWDRNAKWNHAVLEHIVALLFALAGLADLATGAPFLRRRRVLGILAYAEAEARTFVVGMVSGAPVPADVMDTATDAECLAASFRALALMLCALLARAALFALPGAVGERAGCPPEASKPAIRWPRAAFAPDTS